MIHMSIPLLDSELGKYWPLLTTVQKESLLSVIKSIVAPGERISIEQYNKEIDEALAEAEAGNYITQEEMEKQPQKN